MDERPRKWAAIDNKNYFSSFLQPEQEMTHIPAIQRVNDSLATRNIAFRPVYSTGMRQ